MCVSSDQREQVGVLVAVIDQIVTFSCAMYVGILRDE